MSNFDYSSWFGNVNSSCYADCVLFSMFSYSHSPYFKYVEKFKTLKLVLSSKLNTLQIINEVNEKYLKKFPNCDVLSGQQDCSEFYDRLVKLMEFDPCTIYNTRYVKKNEEKVKLSVNKEKCSFIPLSIDFDNFNDFFNNDQWIDMGEDRSNWIKNEDKVFRYTRNSLSKIDGDCFVFYMNRIIPNKNGTLYKTTKKFIANSELSINNEDYFLQSCIIHMGSIYSGHYMVICTDHINWYVYDDMCNKEVQSNKISSISAKTLMNKFGIMFFYFKFNVS